jgi:hypothetical protein
MPLVPPTTAAAGDPAPQLWRTGCGQRGGPDAGAEPPQHHTRLPLHHEAAHIRAPRSQHTGGVSATGAWRRRQQHQQGGAGASVWWQQQQVAQCAGAGPACIARALPSSSGSSGSDCSTSACWRRNRQIPRRRQQLARVPPHTRLGADLSASLAAAAAVQRLPAVCRHSRTRQGQQQQHRQQRPLACD